MIRPSLGLGLVLRPSLILVLNVAQLSQLLQLRLGQSCDNKTVTPKLNCDEALESSAGGGSDWQIGIAIHNHFNEKTCNQPNPYPAAAYCKHSVR
jgi:hypothetical protein